MAKPINPPGKPKKPQYSIRAVESGDVFGTGEVLVPNEPIFRLGVTETGDLAGS